MSRYKAGSTNVLMSLLSSVCGKGFMGIWLKASVLTLLLFSSSAVAFSDFRNWNNCALLLLSFEET